VRQCAKPKARAALALAVKVGGGGASRTGAAAAAAAVLYLACYLVSHFVFASDTKHMCRNTGSCGTVESCAGLVLQQQTFTGKCQLGMGSKTAGVQHSSRDC
jgi:hypothetical protein